MAKDLKYLLFQLNVNREDDSFKPLFRFQSELAKEIVKVNEAYNDPDTIRPYINQILKYDGAKEGKPVSAEMRTAIIKTSKHRLNPESELYNNFEIEFEKAYSVLSKSNKAQNYSSDDIEFKVLLDWQKKSNRTVVLNREPIELKYYRKDYEVSGELITDLINNLIKNFKLNGKSEPVKLNELCDVLSLDSEQLADTKKIELLNSSHSEQYYFRYYVSSFNVAKQLWQSLIKFLEDEINELNEKSQAKYEDTFDLAIKILQMFNGNKAFLNANEKDTSFLKIFKTDGYLTTVPVVYYECAEGIEDIFENTKHHEILFTLILDKNGKRSISTIEGKDLENWKEHVYYPLYWSNENKFKTEEIDLQKALPHIKRTIHK